jgi:pre-mRNA-splicing factor CWC2
MVDAVRSIRALEDGDEAPQPYVDELQKDASQEDEQSEQEEGQPRKRRRIEHGNSSQTEEEEQAPSGPTGLLSAETWEGLRYFAQMKQAQGVNVKLTTVSNRPAPPAARGIGGLGDYGSDEDSD